ncbi:MAG: DNA-3-methyladenine glycosylase [Candidatus Bathyarchaeia archaeon]|jgi:N-glycosylase/DNA lyase
MGLCELPFWLDVTLCCGQVFRWDKLGDWWYGVAGEHVFKVRQINGKFEYVNVDEAFVEHYFGLDDDLQKIADSINKDPHIAMALKAYWGLRCIRQNPWECLISYICATYKSIPAIKHMLNNIAEKFGEKTVLDDKTFYTFPTCEKLAAASEQDLKACGLGYRAKYALATAQRVHKGTFDLQAVKKLPYVEAKKALMELPGVGAKVADCVLFFSLDKTEAFPVDVWVKRVILNHYGDKLEPVVFQRLSRGDSLSSGDYERLCSFGRSYFGKYAGYAQEYLYHFERMAI